MPRGKGHVSLFHSIPTQPTKQLQKAYYVPDTVPLTFRTSCLHFSTLSCNFLSCSGLRDGSALLLASREMASFSSLHAAWWAFFAASTYREKEF